MNLKRTKSGLLSTGLACLLVGVWAMHSQGQTKGDPKPKVAPTNTGDATAVGRPWLARKRAKIAAAQINIGKGVDSIAEMESYIRRAGTEKCDLIALPEYILGPYQLASAPTGNLKRILDAAAAARVYVVVGGWEEFTPGAYAAKRKNEYSNTTLVIDRAGKVIGKYSKTHRAIGAKSPHCWPPAEDDVEWLMKAGDRFPTFQLDFARIGVMTCYDGYFPESASSLSLQGAEIIIWDNGRAGPVEPFIVQADMFRNYCAMVTTNLGPGSGTMIGTWPATILAHITETGSHYIAAEIDLENLRWRRAFSRTFHQRRPKIYGAITKEHRPWEAYPNARLESPDVTQAGPPADQSPARSAAKKRSPRLVVLTFDDSVKSHLTNVAPLLKKHGFGATFFVTHAWMQDRENFLNWDEIARLDAMGFEIGNHSWSHVALHEPEALDILDDEIKKVEEKLKAVGVRKPVSFGWPGNHFGPETRKRLGELGYRFGRRGPMPDAPPSHVVGLGPLYDPEKHDPMLIPSSGLAVPQWQLHDMIEVARRAGDGKIAVFQFHGIPDRAHPSCSLPPERFEEFVEYLARENYTVVSLRDIEKYVRVNRNTVDPMSSKRFFR